MVTGLFVLAAHNTVIALVFALFVYGLTRVWRSPPAAHLLWLLVLLKLVAPPMMHFNWVSIGPGESTHAFDQAIGELVLVEAHRPETSGVPRGPAAGVQEKLVMGLRPFWNRGAPVLLGIWLGGAVLCLLVSATRIMQFKRLLRDMLPASARLRQLAREMADMLAVRRVPEVRYADCVSVPLVWCTSWRPTIVFPMGLFRQLDDQQIAMILAHELAHLRRRDYLVRGIELIVSVIYWWNPLVWVIRRQIHHAEDLCCDAWVRYAFPGETKQYAEVVLKAAELSSASMVGARLLPASPFLHSFSLKARIEMILESRFAPSVSTRSLFVIALVAMLVLPLFVQLTKAEAASGSNPEAAGPPVGKPGVRTSEFPYAVQFEQGASQFLDGDKITVVEVRGTADGFAPGNIYWIKGRYTLASHERAMLAAYTTATNAAEGTSKSFQPQMTEVTKGNGTFALFLPMAYEGWPHVSFYPAHGGGDFGGTYFGTGDSVLKRWWGSDETSAPDYLKEPGHTTFIVGHWDQVGWEMLRKQSPYNDQNLYGRWPMTDVYKKALRNDAKPGDTVFVLLSLDEPRRVPEEFSDLLLLPWSEIESRLKEGQTVFKKGKARDMNVFLLVTPTIEGMRKEFRRLIAEGKFTSDK